MIKASDIGLEKADYTKSVLDKSVSKMIIEAQIDHDNKCIADLLKQVKCPHCKERNDWFIWQPLPMCEPQLTCCECHTSFEIHQNVALCLSTLRHDVLRARDNPYNKAMYEDYQKIFIDTVQKFVDGELR